MTPQADGADLSARRARNAALLARPSSSGRVRFLVSGGAGVVVAVGLVLVGVPRYAVLLGLMTTAATYVVWTFLALRHFDGHATQHHSRKEDAGAALGDIGGLVVIVADLGAVVTLLVLDRHSQTQAVDGLLAVGGVFLSWFLLHTLYVARYARLFYRVDPAPPPDEPTGAPGAGAAPDPPVVGGIDFNRAGYWPTYADFTYFSYNLGMTFQVSDTSVSDPQIRRLVLHHSLLSYFFSTGITASVINVVVGLVG
ncbi:MAG: DUF1345 domain-containing protein [Janthinobacterium lividum]